MGFRSTLKRIWRFLRPQWKAMTDREIEDLDRAVAASMAVGTFGLHPDNNNNKDVIMTGDRLWSLGSSQSQQTRASRISEASSRGYDAGGFAEVGDGGGPRRQQQQSRRPGGPGQRFEEEGVPDQPGDTHN